MVLEAPPHLKDAKAFEPAEEGPDEGALVALVDELALSGEECHAFEAFSLTHTQRLLGVKKHVAFLASLVARAHPGMRPPFLPEHEQCFARLQIRFHLARGSAAPVEVFKLSPALCAAEARAAEQLGGAASRARAEEDAEAEARSREAERQLLALEARSSAKHCARAPARRARARSGARTRSCQARSASPSRVASESVSLELLTTAPAETIAPDDFDAAEWKHVARKSAPGAASAPGVSLPECQSNATCTCSPRAHRLGMPQRSNPCNDERTRREEGAPACSQSQETQVSSPPLCVDRSAEGQAMDRPSALPEVETSRATNAETVNEPDHLQACYLEIEKLQGRLRDREIELREREAEHARQLVEIQEKAEARVRALQFRLYLTNNRILTLEEALANHVEAVGLQLSRQSGAQPNTLTSQHDPPLPGTQELSSDNER
ncbi:hypothetical protein AB1Y20_016872 [Prymnesium parvum]|uniref:Uncharacterized protein n=1 Tax=Prymnesium parvum TaxID=97485 RepID=A0AB34ICH6_PRYPA